DHFAGPPAGDFLDTRNVSANIRPVLRRGGALSEQLLPGIDRRLFLRRAAIMGGGAALLANTACGKTSEDSTSDEGGAGNFVSTPKWKFVFVNHVTTNPFFTPTQYGAE